MTLARIKQIEIAEYRDGTRIRHYLNPRDKHECVGITLSDSEFNSLPEILSDKSYIILCKNFELFTVSRFTDIPRDCEFLILNSEEINDLREAMEIYSSSVRYCS